MPSFSIIYLHVTKGSKYLLNVRILNWGLCILHKPEKCKWFGGIYSIFVEDISLLCWLLTLPQIDKKNKYGNKKHGCGSTSILSMANHTVQASGNFEFLDFVGLAVIVVSFFIVISTTNICKVRLTVVVVILCYKVNGKIKTFPSKDETFECMYIIYKCLILGYLHDESAPVLSKINFKNFSFLFSGCENEKVNCCSSSFQTFCKVLYHFFWGAKIYILLSPTFREIEILIPP